MSHLIEWIKKQLEKREGKMIAKRKKIFLILSIKDKKKLKTRDQISLLSMLSVL